MTTDKHDRANPWYKDAVIYETHVRAFCDSDGDGIGDFKGLATKLDYLVDLGITAIWLLPFYPSPLKDDGYDIADYEDIHPTYGTMADFKYFLNEAHARGLRVINELVINHTSNLHPWFQRARKAPEGSKERDFYVWNKTSDRYAGARIIFKDFETSNWAWDPVAKSYYWHRFFSHQPDLNFDNPAVVKAVLATMDYWMKLGVDGMRLDAVPYLFEREGTSCENLPETHVFLKTLRKHMDRKYGDRLLLAEANQWPEDAVPYFGDGDECHMSFHFPLMPRLFMSLHMEDYYPIVDILRQTPPIHESCQWALFLRNHDELTLEMVTDEERDYMYRVYAHDSQARINLGIRRRLAPLLGNHRRKIELMNSLLFSMPGTPVLYYGDEIGMGDNIYLGDRNGVRTPMQWSADRNAGFSPANPQKLFLPVNTDPEYHFETVNVEAQTANPHSLLWWMKRLIAMRKSLKAMSRGSIEFLSSENRKIFAFLRTFEDERILVVANLSRFVQYAQLDLKAFAGYTPTELFGRTEFPTITEAPYFVTMGPHSFYWFSLKPVATPSLTVSTTGVSVARPRLAVKGDWTELLEDSVHQPLAPALASFISERRWFGGKARKMKSVQVTEVITIPAQARKFLLLTVRVNYADAESDHYTLPTGFEPNAAAAAVLREFPQALIAEVTVGKADVAGALYDAAYDADFVRAVTEAMTRRRAFKGRKGVLQTGSFAAPPRAANRPAAAPGLQWIKSEQSNTSVIVDRRYILKLFRRSQDGINPDLEIGRYLTEKANYPNSPAVAGYAEYKAPKSQASSIFIMNEFVENKEDAWTFTLDALDRFHDRIAVRADLPTEVPVPTQDPLVLSQTDGDALASEIINPYLETARLLGQRVAELHVALAKEEEDAAFAPEPFMPVYLRALYQSMRNLTEVMTQTLTKRLKTLPAEAQASAKKVLDRQDDILARFKDIASVNTKALRIRHHGDLHLGQVLYTGRDFMLIDFEGEPARSLTERSAKRSPLRDVAGMLRSFNYAAASSVRERAASTPDASGAGSSALWAQYWYKWTASAFLKSYRECAMSAGFLPKSDKEFSQFLDLYLLEKAVYELLYELNNRPDWVSIPSAGILELLNKKA